EAPVHDLRSARETCGGCHAPDQPSGDRLRVITKHSNDERSSAVRTVLMLHLDAIHRHVEPQRKIRYRADERLETIGDVELTRPDGSVLRFGAPRGAAGVPGGEWRVMDCTDCHNRIGHALASPAEEVDAALEQGRISAELPFARREAIRVLQADYASLE